MLTELSCWAEMPKKRHNTSTGEQNFYLEGQNVYEETTEMQNEYWDKKKQPQRDRKWQQRCQKKHKRCTVTKKRHKNVCSLLWLFQSNGCALKVCTVEGRFLHVCAQRSMSSSTFNNQLILGKYLEQQNKTLLCHNITYNSMYFTKASQNNKSLELKHYKHTWFPSYRKHLWTIIA